MADTVETQDGETKTRVFISYSRKDTAFVDQFDAALKARGFEPLIDREDISAFEDWWKRLQALMGRADTVVFVLSPHSVASPQCTKEVEYATSLNKRFAPIVCRRVEDGAVPEALGTLNFIFFDDPDQFEASADRLAVALHTDIGWIRKHTEFGEAARRWAEAGRPGPRGLLLRSPLLEEAERWIASRPQNAPAPTGDTRAFVAESRRDSIRRRHRALALVGAFVAVMVAGLAAWWNQNWLKERAFALMSVHTLTTVQERALKPKDSFRECINCPEMVVVPAGNFMMGTPESLGAFDTRPQHKITLAKPFAVSKFELTFAEWDACQAEGGCTHASDAFGRGQQPVIDVNWEGAKQYTGWLSRITGKTYRLLSEAEYEYAARAGTTTAYSWGDDIKLNGQVMANCKGCGSKWDETRTAPVGSFAANGFGLYDMLGNVWEWTEDCYHDGYNGAPTDGSAWVEGGCKFRMVRGGSWNSTPDGLRSAVRGADTTASRNVAKGFRVARTLAP